MKKKIKKLIDCFNTDNLEREEIRVETREEIFEFEYPNHLYNIEGLKDGGYLIEYD